MIKSVFLLLLLTLLAIHAFAQNKKTLAPNINNDEAQIKSQEQVLMTALQKRDTATTASLLDENFMAVEPDRTNNKQQQLQDIYFSVTSWMNNGVVIDSFRLEEMTVHVYNNSAVSTFVKAVYGKEMGYPFDRKVRYHNMWVKKNGIWKEVSSQTARVSSNTASDEQKIKNIIAQREEARLNGDVSVGRRVLAKTYASIDEIGKLSPLSESFGYNSTIDTAIFRQIREANKEVQLKIRVDSFHFQFYNSSATALVNYRLYYNLVFQNEPCEKVFQCNEVLVKSNGFNWQSVSHTETVIPNKPVAARIDPKVYDAYAGKYKLFSSKFYTIIKEDNKLYLGTHKNVELIPENENTFVENGLNFYRIRFIKDEKGNVTQMRMIEYPGVEYSALKVQ